MVQQRRDHQHYFLENATNKYPISYDRIAGDKFILHKSNEQLVLNRIPSDLYLHGARACDILMVTTNKGNHKGYTSREIAASTEA